MRRKAQRKARRGLTLAELMAALAIGALLVTASIAVMGNLSRSWAGQKTQRDSAFVLSPLESLLRADLLHARKYHTTADGFAIQTMASLDAKLERRHLPVTVTYEVCPMASGRWLMRTQRSDSRQSDQAELACTGVDSIRLACASDAPVAAAAVGPTDWETLSRVSTVTVKFEDSNRPTAVYEIRQE